ncbi:MAG: hypothetical protein IJX08_06745 [Clostridia bacterium]|nr:hypothetical protein [Clostridia bacterium]MBQ8399649.1 hypothetical protein [Clostridia bacterium]
MKHFGSISAVLDADVEELTEIEGVGEHTALLLKLIPMVQEHYVQSKLKPRTDFSSIGNAANYFMDYYITKNNEQVCALLLDNSNRLIAPVLLHEGTVNSTDVNPRKIARIALAHNAAGIILAHNHPLGDPTPSDADLYTTKQLMHAFEAIDLNFRAHLVVAGNRYKDAVDIVRENQKYAVTYVAFRANNLPEELIGMEGQILLDEQCKRILAPSKTAKKREKKTNPKTVKENRPRKAKNED